MKRALKNIGSIFLAIIVLFSTFSFTVEQHFCGGELADYSLIGNLERCVMPETSHSNSKETSFDRVPCCQDSSEMIEGTNDELSIVNEHSVEKIQLLAAFVYSYVNLFEGLEEYIIPFKNYAPPLVVKDLPVLYDTFLI